MKPDISFATQKRTFLLANDSDGVTSTNGRPVTGLTKDNFNVVCYEDIVFSCNELKWQPGNTELSGCYSFHLIHIPTSSWIKGEYYQIGIQARTFKGKKAIDFTGQAVITVQSLGT